MTFFSHLPQKFYLYSHTANFANGLYTFQCVVTTKTVFHHCTFPFFTADFCASLHVKTSPDHVFLAISVCCILVCLHRCMSICLITFLGSLLTEADKRKGTRFS